MRSAATRNDNTSPIARDIQHVVSDAQELVKTVQSEGENKLAEMKTGTDTYVRGNAWRAIGISAAAGALVGFLIARR